ncbi:MAG TPA: site-specific integrase [Candidatus Acidoferrales bacterium]|nr:site-specific integrase [Candidatus Acidoferrales bacterium]
MPTLIRAKTGIYHIVSTVNGKRVWRTTGTRIQSQAYEVFLKQTKPDGKLISECFVEVEPFVKANLSKSTSEIYDFTIKSLIRIIGDLPVNRVTHMLIEKYKVERIKEVKAETVNQAVRTIKAFFNILKRWKIIGENPCDGVKEMRIQEKIPVYLTEDELKKLIDCINDKWLKEIVIFAAMTGARLGEVLNVMWDDLDFARKTVLIRSSAVYHIKSGKVRVVPLNETVIRMLEHKRDREGLVFKGKRGGHAQDNHVSRSFRMAARVAKMKAGVHFHTLRHTFASLLVKKGVSLYQVQRLLGHSSPRVTEVYAHLQNSEMHDVVEKLDLNI